MRVKREEIDVERVGDEVVTRIEEGGESDLEREETARRLSVFPVAEVISVDDGVDERLIPVEPGELEVEGDEVSAADGSQQRW